MKNLSSFCLVVLLLTAVGFGCKNNPLATWKTNYLELDTAQTTVEAIKEKIGGDFSVVEVRIQPKEFSMIIQNKDNPNYVDVIKSNSIGIIVGPDLVKTPTQFGNIPKSLFAVRDINFSAIPEFTQEAIAKANIEGAKITELTLGRGFASKVGSVGNYGEVRWIIKIEGTRESVTATASSQGKLLGVDFSRTSQAENYTVFTAEELKKAENSIFETFGKDAQIFSISIREKSISMEVPHPENPLKVKEYSFGINGLAESQQFGSARPANVPALNFSEINLTDAVQLLEKAREKSDLLNGKFSNISVGYSKYDMDRADALPEWRVNLKDGEKDASVRFNLKGNVIGK
jgi:hypothetical protein